MRDFRVMDIRIHLVLPAVFLSSNFHSWKVIKSRAVKQSSHSRFLFYTLYSIWSLSLSKSQEIWMSSINRGNFQRCAPVSRVIAFQAAGYILMAPDIDDVGNGAGSINIFFIFPHILGGVLRHIVCLLLVFFIFIFQSVNKSIWIQNESFTKDHRAWVSAFHSSELISGYCYIIFTVLNRLHHYIFNTMNVSFWWHWMA